MRDEDTWRDERVTRGDGTPELDLGTAPDPGAGSDPGSGRTPMALALLAGALLAGGLLVAPGPADATLQEGDEAGAAPGAHGVGRTAIVIHGGAGTIRREDMSEERERVYRSALREALEAGHAILEDGGRAMDAVIAAIGVMEESPLFNAARGAVFTSEGTVELDASIMDGKTRNAGAVTGVRHVHSPIQAARLVMNESPHVMLAQEGAEAFAFQHGLDSVPNEFFHTERRREAWERARLRSGAADGAAAELGTVGAVALDREGNLAAGTSTGGMTNKKFGRIGDSPIIGAGTYADNGTVGVSATGHGEFFIRGVVAHDVAAMMRYGGLSLHEAAAAVIHGRLTELGGTGGIIALDRQGNVAMPFNTAGMYRGYVDPSGAMVIRIYRDQVERERREERRR